MPLYEYRCNQCGAAFEKMVRWAEAGSSPACPHCQSKDTQKKISIFASVGTSSGNATAASGSCSSAGGFR
jgi:putative FmdB family regulatory protein